MQLFLQRKSPAALRRQDSMSTLRRQDSMSKRAILTKDVVNEEDILGRHSPRRAVEAVEKLKDKPVVSGLLMNREQSWRGESRWKERFVVLDPTIGHLAYWDVKTAKSKKQRIAIVESTAPEQDLCLEDLISIETNEYHHTIMLNFCKPEKRKHVEVGKGLAFQADCEEDFDRWVEILSCYGMKETAAPMAARAA
jgi:hypothetical protein